MAELLVRNKFTTLNLGTVSYQTIWVPLDFNEGTEIEVHEICDYLVRASPQEYLDIYISGYGGDILLESLLINSIKVCRANLTMHVWGPVYSAHTCVALCHPKLEIGLNAIFHFHTMSGSSSDKVSEQVAESRAHHELMEESLENLLPGAITAKEKKQILAGEELYIKGDVMAKRLKKFLIGENVNV